MSFFFFFKLKKKNIIDLKSVLSDVKKKYILMVIIGQIRKMSQHELIDKTLGGNARSTSLPRGVAGQSLARAPSRNPAA
jgi:hypothetical protein